MKLRLLNRFGMQVVATVMLSVALGACSDDLPKVDMNERNDLNVEGAMSMELESRGFTASLLKYAYEDAKSNNVDNFIVSPFAFKLALSTVWLGLDDTRREEFSQRMTGNSRDDFADVYSAVMKGMPKLDRTATMTTGCSLWHIPDLEISDSYRSVFTESYGGLCQPCDLASSEGAAQINRWIADITKGKSNVTYSPSSKAKAVVTGAFYLNAKWRTPFPEKNTSTGEFHNSDGTTSRVKMMREWQDCRFSGSDLFSIVEVPFGNESYWITFVVADEWSLDQVVEAQTDEEWGLLRIGLRSFKAAKSVELSVPKFELDYSYDLSKFLVGEGFGDIVNDCRLPRMTELDDEYDLDYRGGATFKIDESGVELTGTQKVEVDDGANPEQPEIREFKIDKPFLFFITERSSATILLMGAVNKL